MRIHKIKITNFKSIYGTQEFNFDDLDGLIKLSGPIGAGKTTLCEALLYGLYGNVKDQKIPQLVAWNTKRMEVCIQMTTKNNNLYIKRCNIEPLEIYVNDKLLPGSTKRDTQQVLEEYFDVPRLAIEKMCIISFNSFKTSLANMTPMETKQFLDNIFGFSVFTDYNMVAVGHKSDVNSEIVKIESELNVLRSHKQDLLNKKTDQQNTIINELDINNINKLKEELNAERKKYIEDGKELKSKLTSELKEHFDERIKNVQNDINNIEKEKTEIALLGKQEKTKYNTFKSGKCPTCGQSINDTEISNYKNNVDKYAEQWQEKNNKVKTLKEQLEIIYKEKDVETNKMNELLDELRNKVKSVDDKINNYNNEISIYNAKLSIINNNYDNLIQTTNNKINILENELMTKNKDFNSWNDISDMLTKNLRYKLLDSLIPSINNSIQLFINRLEQQFYVRYDQEFKPHIFSDNYSKEITYNALSTGQKKSLDLAIIFGILQNMISNIDFNIIILDELFSNMDSDTRNIMLSLLKENLTNDRSVFVINHAEMQDDYFTHKVKVKLVNDSIDGVIGKQKNQKLPIHHSVYNKVF